MKTLYTLAAAAILGCAPPEQVKPEIKIEVSERQASIDAVSPLKEFLYAKYDEQFGQKREDINELETKLDKALKAEGFSNETIAAVKEGKPAYELKEFFAKQGLLFRSINVPGISLPISYELLKQGTTEQKEMTLFGVTKKYTKIRILESLIDNAIAYQNKKKNANLVEHGYMYGTDMIEYRAWKHDNTAKSYFEGEKQYGKELEDEASKPKQLAEKYSEQRLFARMGTILHHIGVRDLAGNTFEEFQNKMKHVWERDCEIHDVMNSIDVFDFDKDAVSKLDSRNKKRLSNEYTVHLKIRAFLAQLYHSERPHDRLGDLFKASSGEGLAYEAIAATNILNVFRMAVLTDRERFENIDFVAGDAIYAQFCRLTIPQIKQLALATFKGTYKERPLKEYMEKVQNKILNEQKKTEFY